MELCPALGIVIPVGKDSMSMHTRWTADGQTKAVTAPLSLVVSAFAPVPDVRQSVTPQLRADLDNDLLLVDLGGGQNRLGGSVLAQAWGQMGDRVPDLDAPALLASFFEVVQACLQDGLLLAYHDRSDGGLFTTLAEMAFAGHCGLELDITSLGGDPVPALFSEELGAVLQVRIADAATVLSRFEEAGLGEMTHRIGRAVGGSTVRILHNGSECYRASRVDLHRAWAELSYTMQGLRDNPACAREEYDTILDDGPGLSASLTYDVAVDVAAPFVHTGARPRLAILREQGVNSHMRWPPGSTVPGSTPSMST